MPTMDRDPITSLHPVLYAAFIIIGMAAVIGPPLYLLLGPAAP